MFKKFLKKRRSLTARVNPGQVPSPFVHSPDLGSVLQYFSQFDTESDPFLAQPGNLPGRCYICDRDVVFVVLRPADGSPVNWRETLKCPSCKMINRWRSAIHLFEGVCGPQQADRIYLTEALSPTQQWMARHYPNLLCSEFIAGAEPGEMVDFHNNPIRNEDVTRLSFEDQSLDAILSFDVLEHVPDYRAALSQFSRVLDARGQLFLSVPFNFAQETTVRARIGADGEIEHLEEPCYHGDPLSPDGVLSFYDFGFCLLDELRDVGFKESFMVSWWSNDWGYPNENVAFIARK